MSRIFGPWRPPYDEFVRRPLRSKGHRASLLAYTIPPADAERRYCDYDSALIFLVRMSYVSERAREAESEE